MEKYKDILTPLGTKEMSTLKSGDIVLGKGGVENELIDIGKREFDRQWFVEQDLENEFKWYLINEKYKLFHNQNIFVKVGDYGVCHVFELQVGWVLYDENENDVLITSIKEISSEEPFVKLYVDGDHSYFSQGLLLHNLSRYWVGGGSSANWSATANTNWGSSSGTQDNASVPGSADDVTFDGAGVGGNSASTVTTITILSFTATSGYTNTISINSILTVAGNFTDNTAHSWAGTSTLVISATSTITSGGKTFISNVTFSGAGSTKTLSGNWTIGGLLLLNTTTLVLNATTAETMSMNGLTANNVLSGTAKIILTGGTWSGSAIIKNNLDFAGNVTLASGVTTAYNTGTLTYVSGTITTTGNTLSLALSTTLNTNGISFNNLTISGTSTITINSLLTVTGTLTISNAVTPTFAGTAGFIVGTFTNSQSTSVGAVTFVNGVTYIITTAFNCFLTRNGSPASFASDHASNKAILTLNQGATCNVLGSFTRIDASKGRPILTFNGSLTSCVNVVSYSNVEWKTIRGFNRGTRRMELLNRDKVVEYL